MEGGIIITGSVFLVLSIDIAFLLSTTLDNNEFNWFIFFLPSQEVLRLWIHINLLAVTTKIKKEGWPNCWQIALLWLQMTSKLMIAYKRNYLQISSVVTRVLRLSGHCPYPSLAIVHTPLVRGIHWWLLISNSNRLPFEWCRSLHQCCLKVIWKRREVLWTRSSTWLKKKNRELPILKTKIGFSDFSWKGTHRSNVFYP